MTQPFVVSMKITGDGSGASAAVKQVVADVETLQRKVAQTATGQSGGTQGGIDAMLGIGRGANGASRAADIEAYGRELDNLRAKFNPLFAAQQRQAQAVAEINRAQRLGAITADEATAAVMREQAAYDGLTASLRANSAATSASRAVHAGHTTNLLFQAQDIAMMTAMGQSPMMLAMQQGTQVGGIFHQIGNGKQIVQALGGAVMGLLNPLNLATIAVIGLGAVGVQSLIGMIGTTEDATRSLEDHAGWLDEVLSGYDQAKVAVKAYIEEASKLPTALARLTISDQLNSDLATLEAAEQRLADFQIRGDTLIPLSSINDDLALLRQIKSDFDANILSAEEFAAKLQLITMNDNVSREARAVAKSMFDASMEVANLEVKVGAGREALAGLADEAQNAAIRMANLRAGFDLLENSAPFTGLGDALQAPVDAMEKLEGMIPEIRSRQQMAADELSKALTSPSEEVRSKAQEYYDLILANSATLEARREAEKAGRGATQKSEYEQAIESIRDRTTAQQIEAEAVGLSTFAAERLRVQMELENAAREDAIGLTPSRVAEIEAEANGYALATAELERLTQAANDNAAIMGAAESGVAGIFKTWARGGDILESVRNSLLNIGDLLVDMAIRNMFAAAFGGGGMGGGMGGGGGLLGGMIIPGILHRGGIAGEGGYGHGKHYPVSAWAGAPRFHSGTMFADDEFPAILQRGEKVIPRGGSMGAGGVIYVEATMRVVNGNLIPVITEVSGEVAGQKIAQAAPQIVGAAVQQSDSRAVSNVARHQSERAGGDYRVA